MVLSNETICRENSAELKHLILKMHNGSTLERQINQCDEMQSILLKRDVAPQFPEAFYSLSIKICFIST